MKFGKILRTSFVKQTLFHFSIAVDITIVEPYLIRGSFIKIIYNEHIKKLKLYYFFQKCVIDQGKTLLESQHWNSVIDYVVLAWSYVKATPLWDNPPHNASRKQCFKSLLAMAISALKKGTWSNEELNDMYVR